MEVQILFSLALFACVILAFNIGVYFGHKETAKEGGIPKASTAAINGPLLALLGLLLAFTFNGATNRFDDRRALVVTESIAINSLYRNLDYLSLNTQELVRSTLKEYVASRVNIYDVMPNIEKVHDELAQSRRLKEELRVLIKEALIITNDRKVYNIILPILSKMYEVEERRYAAIHTHPPLSIFFLMFGLATIVSFLSGYGMSTEFDQPLFQSLVFAFVIAVTTYITLDIEFPRIGLIIADGQDYLLYESLKAMQ